MSKNIVIIGASYAGHSLANKISDSLPSDYRIILIERNEFVLHPPAVVRACVVPGWENKNLTAPVTQENTFPAGSRHRVLCPTAVTELRKTSVILDREFEGSTELAFEKCVIATGAQQPEPMRPRNGASLDEYKSFLRKMQADFKAAQNILIVGGGTVGVEVAGEINSLYPDKKITIVHTDTALLHPTASPEEPTQKTFVAPPTLPFVSDDLAKQLRKRSVEVILNDRAEIDSKIGALGTTQSIPLKSGKSVEADYIFVSTGNRPNSQLVADVDQGALTSNGYIIVDSLFRVVPGSDTSPMAGEYYALGDVASVKSWKTCVSAGAEGPALGAIIVAQVKGKKPAAYTPPALAPLAVTLGTSGGAGNLPLPIIGNISMPSLVLKMKSNDFFAQRAFYSLFKGPEKVPTSA